jgi:hypothetical protein
LGEGIDQPANGLVEWTYSDVPIGSVDISTPSLVMHRPFDILPPLGAFNFLHVLHLSNSASSRHIGPILDTGFMGVLHCYDEKSNDH